MLHWAIVVYISPSAMSYAASWAVTSCSFIISYSMISAVGHQITSLPQASHILHNGVGTRREREHKPKSWWHAREPTSIELAGLSCRHIRRLLRSRSSRACIALRYILRMNFLPGAPAALTLRWRGRRSFTSKFNIQKTLLSSPSTVLGTSLVSSSMSLEYKKASTGSRTWLCTQVGTRRERAQPLHMMYWLQNQWFEGCTLSLLIPSWVKGEDERPHGHQYQTPRFPGYSCTEAAAATEPFHILQHPGNSTTLRLLQKTLHFSKQAYLEKTWKQGGV
jgi:hypothetical protein